MNLKKSIYYRAKSFVERVNLSNTIERNRLSDSDLGELPINFIEIMETIKNYRLKANILLDIGAYKGLFSKVSNAFFNFDKIICFEPNKEMNEIIEHNNEKRKLVIENIALSNQVGQTIFFLHQDASMNSIVAVENEILKTEFPWDNPDLLKKTIVNTITLDHYIERNAFNNETFIIKIDTQGNELNVLKNGIKTLKQTEICLIEYMFLTPYKSDFSFYNLLEFMNKNEFDCKGALTISKRQSKKISAVDFLFVKR